MVRRSLGLALACALLSACGPAVPTRQLTDWTLTVDGEAGASAVHVPGNLGHGLDDREATYRLRTSVELPPDWRGHDLVLGIPFLRANTRLFVDAQPVPSLDDHVLEIARQMTAHRFRIDAARTHGPDLALELEVHSTLAQTGRLLVAPTLSRSERGDRRLRAVQLYDAISELVTVVATLALALVSFLTWFATPKGTDPKPLELARLSMACGIYAASQLGALQLLVGYRDMGLLFASLLWGALATVQLARLYRGVPRLPPAVTWVVRSMFVVLPLVQRPYMSQASTVVLMLGLIAAVAYVALATLRGARELPELRWMLGCWLLVLVTGSHDGATALGIGAPLEGVQLTCTALVIFVVAQAAIMSRDQAKLHARLREHLVEVERHNREVEQLNVELRRKVGDRSRELAAALRKLEVEGPGHLVEGSVLADLYRVTSRLGAGAMGEVYRVERLSDGRSLAAKVVRGRVRPEALQRFTREAELAARIDHPNVVRVLDVDVSSGGDLFLVMELVEGKSLEELRSSFGDPRFALVTLRQIAGALSAIHAGGVVHRDLKPANVLVSADGAKVADFGIAGHVAEKTGPHVRIGGSSDEISGEELAATMDAPEATPRLTQTGAIMGTPLYMAPEVLNGGVVGPAADLFAYALIAYQLVGGGSIEPNGVPGPRNLFRRATLRPMHDVAPWLGPALATALDRCLSNEPAQRPAMSELVVLLDAVSL